MKKISKRVLQEAEYIINTGKTIRETAKEFSVSKSTVHKDLQERLKNLNKDMSEKITEILTYHTNIRHIRGGESTRKKYQKT